MKLRILIKIVFGLLIVLAVAIGLTSINHPIILKWVTGGARHHGKPIPAIVYTDGQVSDDVSVYYTDEADNYLLTLAEYDSSGTLSFINIDLNEKRIGRPVASSKRDYDLIAGHLFQSKTGGQFSPIEGNIGMNFDPQLTFKDGQIRFNMPPNNLKLDSLRIILP